MTGDAPIDLNAFVEPSLGAIVIGLSIAVVLLVAVVIVLARRTSRIDSRMSALTQTPRAATSPPDAGLEARLSALEIAQRRSFQRVGLVRYNPFEETGGNQSFALALLDATGDGWVLSSLHARSGTRVYAKTITAGRSDATLSDEEADAIRQALA